MEPFSVSVLPPPTPSSALFVSVMALVVPSSVAVLTTAILPPVADVKEPPVTVIWSSSVVPPATAPIGS